MVDDYDRSIHSNPDAKAWAEFFMRSMKQQGLEVKHITEELMLGWFANAMMAMHDNLKNRWVGLTDDEIFDVIRSLCVDNETAEMLIHVSMDEYRAIEAKLKEKNRE